MGWGWGRRMSPYPWGGGWGRRMSPYPWGGGGIGGRDTDPIVILFAVQGK